MLLRPLPDQDCSSVIVLLTSCNKKGWIARASWLDLLTNNCCMFTFIESRCFFYNHLTSNLFPFPSVWPCSLYFIQTCPFPADCSEWLCLCPGIGPWLTLQNASARSIVKCEEMAIGMADTSSLAGSDTGESENRAGQVMSKVLGHLKTQKLYQQRGKSQKASVN